MFFETAKLTSKFLPLVASATERHALKACSRGVSIISGASDAAPLLPPFSMHMSMNWSLHWYWTLQSPSSACLERESSTTCSKNMVSFYAFDIVMEYSTHLDRARVQKKRCQRKPLG